jgi:ABC-type transporter Mla subunit MlaD
MNEATLSALRQLAKCLADASDCIKQLTDNTEALPGIYAQLQSLRLILDNNRVALESALPELARGTGHIPKTRAVKAR